MSDTPIADMIEQMATEGAPLGMIVLAVRHAERYAQRHAQRHAQRLVTVQDPSPGAIRSRRWRENRKQNQPLAEANDAVSGVDEHAETKRHAQRHAVTPHCNLSSSLKKETSEESKKEMVVARARGSRLVTDAALSDSDRSFARNEGMADALIDRMWAEFVDYWIGVPGQRGTKLDWSATWRNWVRRNISKGRANGAVENLSQVASRLATEGISFGPRPSLIPRDTSGGEIVRLLPEGRRERS